MNEYVV